jgi:hypothetical protein
MADKIRRFRDLSQHQRTLLVKALIIVVGVRAGLTLLPFPWFQPLLTRARAALGTKRDSFRPSREQLVWAVRVASTCVPHATCLTQALAVQVLFVQYQYPAVVHIGVARVPSGGGTFRAHAWLESNGQTMIGELNVHYVPLTSLRAEPLREERI